MTNSVNEVISMALSFDELKMLARQTGLKVFCDEEKQMLIIGGVGRNGVCHLIVHLVEDGEALYFRIPYLAIVPEDHPHFTKILLTLLSENDRVKLGRFCLDPEDGEVYIDWFHSIEDGTLTSTQLLRCIKTLMILADEVRARLKHLLETGEDLPEERRIESMLRRLLSSGLPEEVEIRLRRLFQDFETSEEKNEEDQSKE
jgi:hypothetical protein